MGAQGSADGRRGETLAHEELVDARILGLRGNLRLAAELLLEGFGNQRALVGLAERRRERLSGNVLLDAHFLQLALDAQASASFDLHRRPHVRRGDTRIVQRAVLEEKVDGAIDVFLGVLAIAQPLTDLLDGQLTPSEQEQRVNIGGALRHELQKGRDGYHGVAEKSEDPQRSKHFMSLSVLRVSEPLWLTSSLRPICCRSVRSSECLVWPAPWRRAPRRAWRGWRASTPSRRAPCPRSSRCRRP